MTVVDGLVESGQRYRVTAVDGRRPAGLDHCVGIRVLTVDRAGMCHRLFGRGVETSGAFRFHQQDLGSGGTVVLVWTISVSGDGTLVIEPAADR
jgi:hypothetical protein